MHVMTAHHSTLELKSLGKEAAPLCGRQNTVPPFLLHEHAYWRFTCLVSATLSLRKPCLPGAWPHPSYTSWAETPITTTRRERQTPPLSQTATMPMVIQGVRSLGLQKAQNRGWGGGGVSGGGVGCIFFSAISREDWVGRKLEEKSFLPST